MKGTYIRVIKSASAAFLAILAAEDWTKALASPIVVAVGFSDTNAPTYSVDIATGQKALLGSTGFPRLNSLASSTTGQLYSATHGSLVRINPTTGVGQAVATLSGLAGGPAIHGLAFSNVGSLYAIQNVNGAGQVGPLPVALYKINVATGAATHVGSTSFVRITSLDFSPNGNLYAWDVLDGLLTIDIATGAASKVNPASVGTVDIQTLAFSNSGQLYGARNGVYEIDVHSGNFLLKSSPGAIDLRGMSFIPETNTVHLALVAMLSFIGISKRAKGRSRLANHLAYLNLRA